MPTLAEISRVRPQATLADLVDPNVVGGTEASEGWVDRLRRGVGQTWPAQVAMDAAHGLGMFGDAAAGRLPVTAGMRREMFTDVPPPQRPTEDSTTLGRLMGVAPVRAEPIDPYIKGMGDVAGLVTGGSYAAPAMKNATGMGIRSLPADNYRKPLSTYTDKIYRETSPEAALEVLPGSNVSAGLIGGQQPRYFYADTPEMALGQGANKGVRVGHDASAFEGQINQSKPMWAPMFEKGIAEYLASPMRDSDVRATVKSINIDKAALASAPRYVQARFGRLVEKLKSDGWNVADSKQYIDLVRNYGLAGAAATGAMYQGSPDAAMYGVSQSDIAEAAQAAP